MGVVAGLDMSGLVTDTIHRPLYYSHVCDISGHGFLSISGTLDKSPNRLPSILKSRDPLTQKFSYSLRIKPLADLALNVGGGEETG